MRYRILLLADHAWRDIPGLAAVRVNLERINQELDVRIIDIHLFADSIELFRPHLVLMPNLFEQGRNKILDDVRRRGGLGVVLNSEGRPNTVGQLEWATKSWDTRLCDLMLSWSQEFANHLSPEVSYVVTGSPRFDFYHPPLNQLVDSKELVCGRLGLDPNRPIVTVASSFPQAKFAIGGAEFITRDWENLGVTKIAGRENPQEHIKSEWEAFRRFQAWLLILARETGLQIVVKPHPGENVQHWLEFCDDAGIKLMLCDYIFNLYSISTVHVARVDCMTIPEAWEVGLPTIQCKLGDVGMDGAGREAVECKLGKSVVDNIIDLLTETPIWIGLRLNEIPKYNDKWLGPRPGASERVARAIVTLLNDKQPKTHTEPTPEDYTKLHHLLVNHSRQHAIPLTDHIGQFGKAVTLDATNEWIRRVRGIYDSG